MSELKVHRFITTDELFPEANAGVLYYDKSEADKVIADLEESHKMEVEQLLMEIVEKDKEIAELKSMNESLYLRSGNWKALCVASVKAYKKLMKKFVHEASVAESYRSLIYKEDALNAQEKGDSVNYELLSKKSDNCYRHANRWRGIFKKLNGNK